ncbi:MAG TPA: TolC family protein [Thermoanaerobaculia bacterium]
MNESRVSKSARRLAVACLLVLLLPLPALPASAEQPAPGIPLKAELKAPEAVDIPITNGAVELTLQQAIEIALRRNLGIVIERYNRIHARLGVYEALGIYDLNLLADIIADNRKSQVTSTFSPKSQEDQQLGATLSEALPTGGKVSVGPVATRISQTFLSPNLNTIGSSFYSASLTFTYDQPLLRNFGREAYEHGLLVAVNTSQVSQATFAAQVTAILQQVVNAYWMLVDARGQLTVAQDSLGLARELHERNKIQVQVGTLAPLELVQSQATIATREEGIISAQEAVANAADQLRRLLNFAPGQLWTAEIKPTTDPQTAAHPAIDLDASIALGLQSRPELRSQEFAVELAKLNARFAHQLAKPQLDLHLTYQGTGADIGLSPTLSQATNFRFPYWKGELDFSLPLQNRAARAATAIADIDRDRTQYELDQLKTVVITDVRQAARRVETAAKQIDAAAAARKAQETNLDAERKRYENGMSTSFEITRIQDDLTAARSAEITAIVGYRTALADYYRATGTLVPQSGVAIDDKDPAIQRYSFTPGKDEKAYERQ